ncbi:MAG: TonB-dependent receptor [Candidatus Glassbacteria bacterium]
MLPKMTSGYFILLIPIFYALSARAVSAQAEFTEEMLFHQTGKVVTASRTEQSVNQAPATMTVITAKEIKAMGAMSIPEILRYVPGLEVMTITSSHSEVSIRGLSQVPSNNVLVMIDGRSVYIDYYGGTVWESLPILIDQIDRIEIMRSPGSALYGANAFSGVINILTKTSNQITQQQVFVQAGEFSSLNTGLLLGGTRGNTGFRFAAGAKRINSFENDDEQSSEIVLGNFLVEHQFSPDTRLSFDAGINNGYVHKIFLNTPNKAKATNTYSKFRFSHGHYSLQAFWNRGDQRENTYTFKEAPLFYGVVEDIFFNTFDLEAQGMNRFWESNTLVYGASYRLNTIRSNILDESHEQNLSAFFIQEESKISPEITISAGARIDHHPLVGTNVSPRGNLVYSLSQDHTFRFSFGKAFRNPTYLNTYIDYTAPNGIYFVGNKELSPEKITSYELGYVLSPSSKVRLELDIFGLKFRDYIFLDPTGVFDFPTLNILKSYHNRGSAKIIGSELSLELLPWSMLKINANYSNQHMTNNYSITNKQYPPKNKASVRLNISLPSCFETTLGATYIGKTIWNVPTRLGLYEVNSMASHTRVDWRLGYSPKKDHFEVFMAAYNLLDNDKQEYPNSEAVQRRITVGAYFYF